MDRKKAKRPFKPKSAYRIRREARDALKFEKYLEKKAKLREEIKVAGGRKTYNSMKRLEKCDVDSKSSLQLPSSQQRVFSEKIIDSELPSWAALGKERESTRTDRDHQPFRQNSADGKMCSRGGGPFHRASPNQRHCRLDDIRGHRGSFDRPRTARHLSRSPSSRRRSRSRSPRPRSHSKFSQHRVRPRSPRQRSRPRSPRQRSRPRSPKQRSRPRSPKQRSRSRSPVRSHQDRRHVNRIDNIRRPSRSSRSASPHNSINSRIPASPFRGHVSSEYYLETPLIAQGIFDSREPNLRPPGWRTPTSFDRWSPRPLSRNSAGMERLDDWQQARPHDGRARFSYDSGESPRFEVMESNKYWPRSRSTSSQDNRLVSPHRNTAGSAVDDFESDWELVRSNSPEFSLRTVVRPSVELRSISLREDCAWLSPHSNGNHVSRSSVLPQELTSPPQSPANYEHQESRRRHLLSGHELDHHLYNSRLSPREVRQVSRDKLLSSPVYRENEMEDCKHRSSGSYSGHDAMLRRYEEERDHLGRHFSNLPMEPLHVRERDTDSMRPIMSHSPKHHQNKSSASTWLKGQSQMIYSSGNNRESFNRVSPERPINDCRSWASLHPAKLPISEFKGYQGPSAGNRGKKGNKPVPRIRTPPPPDIKLNLTAGLPESTVLPPSSFTKKTLTVPFIGSQDQDLRVALSGRNSIMVPVSNSAGNLNCPSGLSQQLGYQSLSTYSVPELLAMKASNSLENNPYYAPGQNFGSVAPVAPNSAAMNFMMQHDARPRGMVGNISGQVAVSYSYSAPAVVDPLANELGNNSAAQPVNTATSTWQNNNRFTLPPLPPFQNNDAGDQSLLSGHGPVTNNYSNVGQNEGGLVESHTVTPSKPRYSYLGSRDVICCHVEHPKNRLTNAVGKTLIKEIGNKAKLNEKVQIRAVFRKAGKVRWVVADDFTEQWLKDVVGRFKFMRKERYLIGRPMEVKTGSVLVRVYVRGITYIRNDKHVLQKFKDKCGLPVERWALIASRNEKNCKMFCLKIDKESMEMLQKVDMKAEIYGQKVKFKVMDKSN